MQLRNRSGGYLPELDFAIYLHRRGDALAAEEHFANLRAMPLPYRIKATPREWVMANGERAKFDAVLSDLRFRSAYVRVPTYAEPLFIDPALIPSELQQEGSRLGVHVFYNCFGLKAVPITGTDDRSPNEMDGDDSRDQARDEPFTS